MAGLLVLVDIAQLSSAAKNMNTALERYRGAIDNVNASAKELASKWEGDGQKAFVTDQDAAYKWYNSLVEVTREMIAEANRTVQRYRDRIDTLKGQM